MKTLNKKTWQYEKHGIDGEEHEFATKETSNNVWCFYLPKE